mgnify:CR=1 FL=1
MRKLHSLREHLVKSVPGIRGNPERLLTFIEDGAIAFQRGESLSHQYRIPVKIVLTDQSADIDTVMIPLLQWLSHYQPDLDPDEAVRFQAELLTDQSWDLAIEVTLTERVVARVNCATGMIESEHRIPEYPIETCPATHWQLHTKAPGSDEYEIAAEWDSPGE